MKLAQPLIIPDFRRLFVSASLSSIGDWLDLVALLVIVSSVWSDGAFGLASVSVAIGIPNLIAPAVGVYVDRLSRRTVLVWADVMRALLTALLVITPSIVFLLPIVLLRALIASAFNAAEQATIRAIVPEDRLIAANSLNQVMMQGAKIVGPAVGGLLVATLGPREAFAINSISFAVSAVILFSIAKSTIGRREGDVSTTFWHDLLEGATYVMRSPRLRAAGGVIAALMLVIFLYDSMAPLAIEGLGLRPAYVGYLMGAVGAGGAAGAFLVGQTFSGNRPFVVIGVSVVMIGAIVATIGAAVITHLRVGPFPWLSAIFVLGVASAGVLIPYSYVIQTSTPPQLMGRVVTIMSVIPGVACILAPPLAAGLVSRHGVGWVFGPAGIVLVLIGLVVTTLIGRGRSTDDSAHAAAADTG